MRQVKISRWLAGAVVCSLFLAAGCAPPAKEVAKPQVELEKQIPARQGEGPAVVPKAAAEKATTVALKFSPGDSTTYRVITESGRRIKWEGPLPEEPTFKGGSNNDRFEMTFAQEIQSVDANGNAVAKITIKELKYSSIVKDNPVFEFDSSKPKDPNHPLAKLIGQSYTIKIAPTGEVIEVVDTKEAEMAARRGSVPPVAALRLLNSEAIKERHGTLVLPDANKNQLHIGDNWSGTKTFSFGMMGSESYEKIYTLNKIKDQNNRQVAVIEMNAIPASETAKEQAAGLLKSFDNTKAYTGELELDLTAGKVKKYLEKLQPVWITAFPLAKQEPNQEPAVLTMSATRFYSLEKID
ncbi:MAG: hypothetical protein ABSG99_07725 [Sedimentisphaerales bacterium]